MRSSACCVLRALVITSTLFVKSQFANLDFKKFGFYGMISLLCLELVLCLLVGARHFTDKPPVPSRYEGYPVRGAKIEDDGFSF